MRCARVELRILVEHRFDADAAVLIERFRIERENWAWRIEITPEEGRGIRMVMFNIWPENEREELAMESIYTPA